MGEEHEVDGRRGKISQLRRNQRRKGRDRHPIRLRQTVLPYGVLYGRTRRTPQSPRLLRRWETQARRRLRLSTDGSCQSSSEDGEERALWKDSPQSLRNFP